VGEGIALTEAVEQVLEVRAGRRGSGGKAIVDAEARGRLWKKESIVERLID
jgi:hypothetical protein